MAFSTPDRDNDPSSSFNCALSFKGGWWFNRCYLGYLNGRWAPNVWQTPWYPTVMTELEVKETQRLPPEVFDHPLIPITVPMRDINVIVVELAYQS